MDGRRKERVCFFFFFSEGGKGWGEERGREGSHLPSIFTGSELLNWELELERVPETLQIQLHLEREEDGGGEGEGNVRGEKRRKTRRELAS